MNIHRVRYLVSPKLSRLTLWVTLSLFVFPSVLLADQFKATGTIDAYFSPNGRTAEASVNEINSAKSVNLVQGYSKNS